MENHGCLAILGIFTSFWIASIDCIRTSTISTPATSWNTTINQFDDSTGADPLTNAILTQVNNTRNPTPNYLQTGDSKQGVKSPSTDSARKEKFDSNICLDFPIPQAKYKSKCCRHRYSKFTEKWNEGSYYLVEILEVMKRWECEEFKKECENPTWSFTKYSRRIYDIFCRRNELEKECYDDVIKMVTKYGFESKSTLNSWTNAIESLDSSVLSISDLTNPCIQVALFDRKDGGVGRFHEVIEGLIPFCGLQWQGYDYNTTVFRGVSPWTGLSAGCKGSVIICIVVIVVACMTTIIGNLLVLVVFVTAKKLQDSQAIYKIALAIADLMIGIVVWPNMIVMQYLIYWRPRTFGAANKHPYRKTGDMTPYSNPNLTYFHGGGRFQDIFQSGHVAAVGYISTLGITVSIYILLFASIDRFYAVFKPLKYNRYQAKKQAILLSGTVWVISLIVCMLPIFTPGYRYKVLNSNFIGINGHEALTFVLMKLILPLILSWIITTMTFLAYRKHAEAQRKIYSTAANRLQTTESRLAKTLAIMIGVFTLSTLPAICTIIASTHLSVTKPGGQYNANIEAFSALMTSEYLAIIILTANSMWNFFIYTYRTRGFKEVKSHVLRTARKKTGIESLRRSFKRILDGSKKVENWGNANIDIQNVSSWQDKVVNLRVTVMSSPESSLRSHVSTFAPPTTDESVGSSHIKRIQSRLGGRTPSIQIIRGSSIFRSFTINARTDRLVDSVIENIPGDLGIESKSTEV